MNRSHNAFTLVEILIVVMILGILAAVVIPTFTEASTDARESALEADLSTLWKQIDLYEAQHTGKSPAVNEKGSLDANNLSTRLTGRTDPDGKLNAAGDCGPYMPEWPGNPFVTGAAGTTVKFGLKASPPRTGETGWYFSLMNGKIYANSTTGGESFDP